MIDLSKFVDKQVRVTFENGQKYKGKFEYCHLLSSASFPYVFWGEDNTPCNRSGDHYNKNGVNGFAEVFGNSHNITHIEEPVTITFLIKPMNKYEELEKQVAEMQKEIDRLKREEKKYPDLKPVEVIRTVIYTPEEYLDHCKDWEEEPTPDGFMEYVSCWKRNADCFVDSDQYTQEIKVIGE